MNECLLTSLRSFVRSVVRAFVRSFVRAFVCLKHSKCSKIGVDRLADQASDRHTEHQSSLEVRSSKDVRPSEFGVLSKSSILEHHDNHDANELCFD